MTKIRDVDKEHDSFLALKPSRAKATRAPKVDKATENHIADLEGQVDRLSRANLALTNLLKRAIHLAPSHLQRELTSTWDAIRDAQHEDAV